MKKLSKIYVGIQLFSVVTVGLLVNSYFTKTTVNPLQASAASSCTISANVWDCIHYKTAMPTSDGVDNINYDNTKAPTALTLGQTYTLITTINVKQKMPSLWNGGDIFGLGINKIKSSGNLNLDPNDNSITINDLASNRVNGNDVQQAVDSSANFLGFGLSWDTYQCGEQWDKNYSVGDTFSFTCKFTPEQTGYFQLDANSFDCYNNGNPCNGGVLNCDNGNCGTVGALFLKVIKPVPVQQGVSCSQITLENKDTGQVYANGSNIPTTVDSNGQPNDLNLEAVIQGKVQNVSDLTTVWTLQTQDVVNNTSNSIDSSVHSIHSSNGSTFADEFDFNFGQILNSSGTVTQSDTFNYTVRPTMFFVNSNGQTITVTADSNCIGNLVTNSAGPKPTSSIECAQVGFSDANTGQVYPNGGEILTSLDSNGNPIDKNIVASVNGTSSNVSSLSVVWQVQTIEANNGTINTFQSPTENITTDSSGNWSNNSFTFKFGQIPDKNGKVEANDSFIYTLVPLIFLGSQQEQTGSSCVGELTTASSVLPSSTSASVAITKQLVTAEPVLVGGDVQFKIVITDNGTEALDSVRFSDNFGNDGKITYDSGSVLETNNGVSTASQDLGVTASNGTTSGRDLVSMPGFKALNPGDSFTILLNFTAQTPGLATDTATTNATSQSGINLSASAIATVTISSVPVSPNTGAPTPVTLAGILMLLVSMFGRKPILKLLGL